MKKKNIIINIIQIMLSIFFIISIVPKAFQNDTFFTIAIGNNILKNGFTNIDTLTWHENLAFPHSGFFDIIIATIYNKLGFDGIYIYTILMAILIFIVSTIAIYYRIKNINISILLSTMIMYFSYGVFTARAQEISFFLFILEFLFIEKLLETNKKRYGVALIIIGILLANLHSSVYPVYFILYLPYIAEYILSKFNFRLKNICIEKKENIKTLFIVFGISLFTGLCTTTGLAPYTDMIKAMLGVSTTFISELANSSFDNNIVFYKILIAVGLVIIFGKIRVKITDILYILGFGAMTFVAYRCFYFFLLISGIPIVQILVDFVNEYVGKIKNENDCYKEKYKILVCIVIYISILFFSINKFTSKLSKDYIDYSTYPVDATNYILENVDVSNMKIFNHFNWGSYLEFKGIKAFIDSRSGMFCEEFNPGVTILEDWLAVDEGKIDYQIIFDKYEITHVLLESRDKIYEKISKDSKWNVLFESGNFALYERIK